MSDHKTIGFPSPAENYAEDVLSLDEHLIEHHESTFMIKADSDAMAGFSIRAGDLLVIDRSVTPVDQQIVVSILNGDFIIRQYCPTPKGIVLRSGSDEYPDILITHHDEFAVWGVARWSIHSL